MNRSAKQIFFISNTSNKKIHLGKCRLDDIFPHLLVSSSNATIEMTDDVTTAVSMLVRLLESFTNHLVVINNGIPIGVVGSTEILKGFFKNPKTSFFNNIVKNMMSNDLCIVNKKTKLANLLKKMQKYEIDFAILQNEKGVFSTISTRRLLELGILCDTDIKISQIQKKNIFFCTNDETIRSAIYTMLTNHTNVLVIKNTPFIITGRVILEKIQNELKYNHEIDNFLDYKIKDLDPYEATITNNNLSIPDMCNLMLKMKHPYIMTSNQVFTPYDLVTVLS